MLHTVSEAINECLFLDFIFLQTPAECEYAANDFTSSSRGGAIHQCGGRIYGYLAELKQVSIIIISKVLTTRTIE